MKPKSQQQFTSEFDAKEKLIVYVYEYLIHSGAKQAADTFKESIGYAKDIKINEGPGFLNDWWCVFWDLYCAAPERRHTQPESTSDARAFHDFMKVPSSMSPSVTQTSPPQHLPPHHQHPHQPHHPQHQPPPPPPQQQPQPLPPPGQYMGGPRYGPPPIGHPRGPPPRMQAHHNPPGPPSGFMPAGSPRYAQHTGSHPPPPPQQQHMPPGSMFVPGPAEMSHSPNLSRNTPDTGPPSLPPGPQQHQVPGPPPPQMIGMPVQQMAPGQVLQPGPPPQHQQPPPPQQQQQQQTMQGPTGPPRNGSQGSAAGSWQGNINYNVNSPFNGPPSNQSNQPGTMMMSDPGMVDVKNSPVNGVDPSTPHSEDYVMPVPFGQDTNDQCDSAEILKLKQSMQEDTTKMFEKGQSEFGMNDYSDSQGKWT